MHHQLATQYIYMKTRQGGQTSAVICDPGRECSGAWAGKCPTQCFWVLLGTCLGVPQRVLFECFLALLGLKSAKKHSKSTLWGTPRQVPKTTQKALRGALSGPGPWALLSMAAGIASSNHVYESDECTSYLSKKVFDQWQTFLLCRAENREGANREKLTVKKLISNEMFFHRLCPL